MGCCGRTAKATIATTKAAIAGDTIRQFNLKKFAAAISKTELRAVVLNLPATLWWKDSEV